MSAAADLVALRVQRQDISLFDALPAELTEADRRMLLALQDAVARQRPGYVYLEVGSHRGGSIQPHLLDERCARIVSIDPRPPSQPDQRGSRFHYPDNSTARMLGDLARLAPSAIARLHTFDLTAQQVAAQQEAGQQKIAADLILIDGEHTNEAALADFEAVLALAAQGAVIIFHDAPVVYQGLAGCLRVLARAGRAFSCFPLPDTVFVIVLDEADALGGPAFAALRGHTGTAYLSAMMLNNGYRRFHHLVLFRVVRSLLSRCGLGRFNTPYQYGADRLDV